MNMHVSNKALGANAADGSTASETMLAQRAMLAHVKITCWSARKFDKTATEDVREKRGTENGAGRYNKKLLPPQALAPITQHLTSVRAYHYAKTRAWRDDGARILPSMLFTEYAAYVRTQRSMLEPLVTTFIGNWEHYKEGAKALLGELYDEQDYPPASELRDKFGIELLVEPLPTAGDFRASLDADEVAWVREQIERQTKEALRSGQQEIYVRVRDALTHMVEKLEAYAPSKRGVAKASGVFRDTLVTNIRDIAAAIPALNIENDSAMADLSTRLLRLTDVSPGELRASGSVRVQAKRSASDILAHLNGLIVP